MTYERFHDLPVWQTSAHLYNLVLDLFETPALPLSSSFRNQLERAALSISNNIAEGFERRTTGELINFLAIAQGSAGEVRSMMAVIQQRPRLSPFLPLLKKIEEEAHSCTPSLDLSRICRLKVLAA